MKKPTTKKQPPSEAFKLLEKMCQVQNDLHKFATKQMQEDRADGIRWAKHLENHHGAVIAIIHDAQGHSDITTEEEAKLNEIIG
jgi:hypothetical protein